MIYSNSQQIANITNDDFKNYDLDKSEWEIADEEDKAVWRYAMTLDTPLRNGVYSKRFKFKGRNYEVGRSCWQGDFPLKSVDRMP